MIMGDAIKTALSYESKIEDLYRKAQMQVSDPVGKRIFKALAEEERNHVAYLNHQLEHWRKTGTVSPQELETALPAKDRILSGIARLNARMAAEDRKDEKQILSKALAVEVETSQFYERMVAEMEAVAGRMFARFLEIEAGHIAMVQAELDYISRTGYWFDFKEFDMEEL